MLEDDIQYLGTRTGPRASLTGSLHPFTGPQRSVGGIAMHVQKWGDQPAYGMLYHRSNFNSIDIGRRPGGTIVEKRYESTERARAMFRCPVISRRHAKITFSDCGHVYLTDLNSHHGTHILNPGDVVSRTLKPDTPLLLADGDVVTFGKTVGKDNQTVPPIVVRIEFLYEGPTENAGPCLSPTRNFKPLEFPTEPIKIQTGRYGVYVPSSHGSDDSSQYDPDSDIEEWEGPTTVVDPATPDIPSGTPIDTRFECEARAPSLECYPRSPSEDPYSFSDFPSPPDNCSPSPRYSVECGLNDFLQTSRYTSPMDLSSPSPTASVRTGPEAKATEANHFSRSSSPTDERSRTPEIESLAESPEDRSDVVATPLLEPTPKPSPEPIPEPTTPEPVSEEVVVLSRAPQPERPLKSLLAPDTIPQGIVRNESAVGTNSPSNDAPTRLDGPSDADLSHLNQRAKTPSEASVDITTKHTADVNDRVHEVYALYLSLADQVENVAEVDVPDLQASVECLQNQIDKLNSAQDAPTDQTVELADREDVKANIDTLKTLVNEMKALREKAERQIAAELEAVKTARMAALAAISSQVQTPLPTSLKRKRSDDEDECVSVSCVPKIRAREVDAVSVRTKMDDMIVRSRKRSRLMTTVAQTAAAVTIGAVVTWSALAFS